MCVCGFGGLECAYLLNSCDVKTETTRYPYFVAVLNEILHHFRKPKNTINDGDIIFAINDPAIIESHNLPTPTKRKPDIICLLAARFKSMFDSENLLFPALMNSAKTRRKSMDLTWGDILQSWELGTSGNKITSKIRRNFKAQEFLDRDEESRINEPAGPSTSQGKCLYVPWTRLMVFHLKLLRLVVSSVKELRRVFFPRRKPKLMTHYHRSSQNFRRSCSAHTTE